MLGFLHFEIKVIFTGAGGKDLGKTCQSASLKLHGISLSFIHWLKMYY